AQRDPAVELGLLALHPIAPLRRRLLPTRPLFRREVEEEGDVGRETAGGDAVAAEELLRRKAATRALVGAGGEPEPVGDHHPPLRQPGAHHLLHEGGTRRQHQEQLAPRRDLHLGLVQDQRADPLPEGRGAGLARDDHEDPPLPEEVGEQTDLGRLARALDALERKEKAPSQRHRRSRGGARARGDQGAGRACGRSGITKWKALPPSSPLSTQIRPPCASTASLQKVSPSPELACPPGCTLAYLRKIVSWKAGGIPTPSSATVKSVPSPPAAGRAESSMETAAPPCRSALPIRLEK